MLDVANLNSNKRTKNIKLQIFLSFFFRGLSIILSFFVVRITIDYLGKDLYGIWIVLLSIISWLSLFDIGVGNGLRNKLTIALSNNDFEEARIYISTAYIILTIIAISLLIILIGSIYFINWISIFNSSILNLQEYRFIMIIFIFSILISFVLGLINSILNAYQKTSLTNIISIISNFFFIVFLIFFKDFFLSNIIKIISIYSLSLIFSHLIISFIFFSKNKNVSPNIKYFSKSKIKDIMSLGSSFFVIQIAVLLIFTVDNYLILHLLGTEQVSTYNIIFKLFSIFTVAFGIIIAPLWSAFTEANQKKDYIWMYKMIKRLNVLFIFIVLGVFLMSNIYQPILDFWLPLDNRIVPSSGLMIAFSFFILISIWNNIYSFFLNGIGIVKMQMITAIIGAFLNIPLAVFLVKILGMGLSGIVYAMCLSLILFSVLGPIVTYQYFKTRINEKI